MANTTLVDVHSPTMNLLQDRSNEHNMLCRILDIHIPPETSIKLHFDTPADWEAFKGMIGMLE